MNIKITEEKKQIRNIIKEKLSAYRENFQKDSEIILKKIINSQEYKNAGTIFTYLALPDEVNIPLSQLDKNKKIYIPKVNLKTTKMDFYLYTSKTVLEKGAYNILEPANLGETFGLKSLETSEKILVLVPGRGFTKTGHRLGRGKGYYDKFFQEMFTKIPKENVTLAGICFPPQIVESIPTNSFDVSMDYVITSEE